MSIQKQFLLAMLCCNWGEKKVRWNHILVVLLSHILLTAALWKSNMLSDMFGCIAAHFKGLVHPCIHVSATGMQKNQSEQRYPDFSHYIGSAGGVVKLSWSMRYCITFPVSLGLPWDLTMMGYISMEAILTRSPNNLNFLLVMRSWPSWMTQLQAPFKGNWLQLSVFSISFFWSLPTAHESRSTGKLTTKLVFNSGLCATTDQNDIKIGVGGLLLCSNVTPTHQSCT